jgi:hypothetical protein
MAPSAPPKRVACGKVIQTGALSGSPQAFRKPPLAQIVRSLALYLALGPFCPKGVMEARMISG